MPRFALILLMLGCLLCAHVQAEDAVIVCEPPMTNTDDTPVVNPGIRLYGAISNTIRQTVPAGQPCRFVESNLTPGVHSWYVTAFTTDGESVPSNPVSKTVAATPVCGVAPATQTRQAVCPAPTIGNFTQTNAWTSAAPPACWTAAWLPTDPPAGVCAAPALTTASTSAYQYKSATLPMALVGLVPQGVSCGPEVKTVNAVKYCKVPKSLVDLVVWPSDLALTEYWVRTQ